MQVCTSLQTDDHAIIPPLSFFTGRMPFLPPNQQRQSTEGNNILTHLKQNLHTTADVSLGNRNESPHVTLVVGSGRRN